MFHIGNGDYLKKGIEIIINSYLMQFFLIFSLLNVAYMYITFSTIKIMKTLKF